MKKSQRMISIRMLPFVNLLGIAVIPQFAHIFLVPNPNILASFFNKSYSYWKYRAKPYQPKPKRRVGEMPRDQEMNKGAATRSRGATA